jgi:hypothetical protein
MGAAPSSAFGAAAAPGVATSFGSMGNMGATGVPEEAMKCFQAAQFAFGGIPELEPPVSLR